MRHHAPARARAPNFDHWCLQFPIRDTRLDEDPRGCEIRRADVLEIEDPTPPEKIRAEVDSQDSATGGWRRFTWRRQALHRRERDTVARPCQALDVAA